MVVLGTSLPLHIYIMTVFRINTNITHRAYTPQHRIICICREHAVYHYVFFLAINDTLFAHNQLSVLYSVFICKLASENKDSMSGLETNNVWNIFHI